VLFAEHDHVIETLATDRADQTLRVGILPGRTPGPALTNSFGW
jgi:hypothetical protein